MKIIGPGFYRFFLALLVVVHHASSFALGAFAVYAFFNLSGYWMASVWRTKYSLADNGYQTFIKARFFRLVPLFMAANLLGMAIDGLTHRSHLAESLDMGHPLALLHFIASNLGIMGYNFLPYRALGPAWSLDVEMQFYILLPMFALLAQKTHWMGMSLLLLVAYAAKGQPAFESILGYAAFFYMGMLASESNWRPSKRQAVFSGVVCIGMVLALAATSQGKSWIIGGAHQAANSKDLNAMLCSALALIALPATIYTTTIRPSPADKILGDLSYSVYLIHWPIVIAYGYLFGSLPMAQRLPYLALYIVITGVISLLAWRFIDKPVMDMRARYLQKVTATSPRPTP